MIRNVIATLFFCIVSVVFLSTLSAQPLNVDSLRASRFAMWLKDQPEPVSHGDAPRNKTVVILSPFNAPRDAQDDTSIYFFDDSLLEAVQKKLTAVGYTIEGGRAYINQAVTVKAIYDAFVKSPGVIYFNTHGGALGDGSVILSTGELIPPASCVTDEAMNKYIDRLIQTEFGRLASLVRPFIVGSTPNEGKNVYLAITNGFFDLLKRQRADFSSSLVYIDGCEAAQSQAFRTALHARAFLGWKADCAPKLGKILVKHFFDCLVLKTRSDREAYDYAMQITAEDNEVKMRMQHGTKGWDVKNFQLYRLDKSAPETWLSAVYRSVLMTVRTYVIRDPEANTLAGSIQLIWDNRHKNLGHGLGANPFYRDAFASGEPTDQQLTEIKGELCGFPAGAPRFTLIEK